jgi:hypothetical protein
MRSLQQRGAPPARVGRRILVALALATLASCAARARTPTGAIVEEFEGFPIYHGEPTRPYRVLGGVYDAEAATRGVSPMKRASVAAARRHGADAIVVGVVFQETTDATPRRSTTAELTGALGKWQHAVAIRWE